MVHDRRSIMNTTIHKLMQWVLNPPAGAAPPATLLIRLMAGGVFVGEGLLKFVFPATLGMGRFHALGIPAPELMATFVGLVEIVGGLLFLLGWFTRLAAIPLMIDIVVAILSTKIPLWLGTSPLPPPPVPPQVGFWAVGAGCAPGTHAAASAGERRTEGGRAMTRDDRGRSLNGRTRMAMLGGG